ncbi:hypothetical protein NIES208_05205 [[Limnothrix rosea] IAM M-220]|nr:hypothetical protein NIES208_05205 [[Limnothrix rosea] IAM M-220]
MNETPDPKPEEIPEEPLPSPLRCWSGTAVASSMSFAAFLVTRKVITNFASTPPTGNDLALRIAITVRTLVVGVLTMATGVFGLIALGLLLLGVKSLLESLKNPESEEAS